MYQSFQATVVKGRIQPTEKVRLRNSVRLIVTVMPEDEIATKDWVALERWSKRQRKAGKLTSYSTIEGASKHLQRLMKK